MEIIARQHHGVTSKLADAPAPTGASAFVRPGGEGRRSALRSLGAATLTLLGAVSLREGAAGAIHLAATRGAARWRPGRERRPPLPA